MLSQTIQDLSHWQTNKQTNKRTDTHTYKQTHVVGPLGLGPRVGAKGYFRGGIFGRGLSSGSCLQRGGYLLESQTEQQLDGETCTQWTTVVSGPSTSPSYQVPRSLAACPWCWPVPADTPVHAPPESCVALPPCASPASVELASRCLVEPRPSIIHTCSQKNILFCSKVKVYVDLYSVLDDKHLVLNALRHGSHSLTCKQRHARL